MNDFVTNQALFRTIAEACAENDSTSLPEVVVDALRAEQGFSLLLPKELGGKQPAFPEFIRFVKSVATADGSTGWCVAQGSVLASLARLLPKDVAESMWPTPNVSLANGPPIQASSRKDGDNYVLSGNWAFSSGINHASWLFGVATVTEEDGSQRGVWHVIDKSDAEINYDWQVAGLKATGSYPFQVEELSIPESMAFEVGVRKDDPPIYQIPLNLLFACSFASVALGVSRAALNFATERVQKKIKRMYKETMSEDMLTQDQIGKAEALWRSADMYLNTQVAEVWERTCCSGICSMDNRIMLRLAGTHTIHQAKAVTDIVYDLCSTDSIFQHNDIQRRFQDIHVIAQHMQGIPEIYSIVGRHFLGLPVNSHLV
ncbi:MAG TPA: hypothetical protein DCM54_08330 [Gammaproteobacteria bacterium]|nr:hypothetical protein [Gammaproteobacteria bacterium]|tara:strand:+ start:280 stop:1398 length:1119 start_codon:yes stop_codon:yes gene_type:complete